MGDEPPGCEFTGILDTGFSGFVRIPKLVAMSLNLSVEGTTTSTLANGHSDVDEMARAQATFADDTRVGVVVVGSIFTSQVLVGMDFLMRFEQALLISPIDGVALVDEAS